VFIKNKKAVFNLVKFLILLCLPAGLFFSYWQYRQSYTKSFDLFKEYIEKNQENCPVEIFKNFLVVKPSHNPEKTIEFLLKTNVRIDLILCCSKGTVIRCIPEELVPHRVKSTVGRIEAVKETPIVRKLYTESRISEKNVRVSKRKKCNVLYSN